jgi:PIN domain nuclease of toxin-antitoxin system
VLDTHAWVWLVADPSQLSAPAKRLIDRSVRVRELLVSSISVWEVAMLVARGRLELTMDVGEWVAQAEQLPFLTFVPVNNRIALEAVRLPQFPRPDPADRIVVATAMVFGAALVTRDERLRAYPRVRTVW